jgi:hypothetical protein
MGIHVQLRILPWAIDPAAWVEAYDESLALLRSHPARLLGYDCREVEGVRVPMYTDELESRVGYQATRGWRVVGDLASRETAECFELARDLSHYRARAPRAEGDILILAARDDEAVTRVFGEKTQGLPYHVPVLAAAMVVETRFPRHAMVTGEVDLAEAERARSWAESVLRHSVGVPARVDPAALARRLGAVYEGPELLDAFSRLVVTDFFERDAPILAALPRSLVEPWYLARLGQTEPPTPESVRLLAAWLDATSDLESLCRLACLDARGPRWPRAPFVAALAHTGIADPEPPAPAAKREDEPYRIEGLLGVVLEQLAGVGRHLRTAFSRERIAAAFEEAFGLEATPLLAALDRETAAHRATWGAWRRREAPAGSAAETPAGSLYRRLIEAAGPADLAPDVRDVILGVTWAARRLRAELEAQHAEAGRRRASDARAARRALAQIVAYHGPRLTERAWQAIREEPDTAVLGLMTALCFIETYPASQVARALLENLALARFAAAAATDEVAMARAAAAIAQVRRQ